MKNTLFDLSGRIALVSGAASGMGRAMALGFAEAGADLMLADINTEGMENTAALVEKIGRRVLPITCDVSQPDLIRAMFNQLDQKYGRIDILGNVAGEGVLARAEEVTMEQVQQVLQSLVIGRFCCCQEAGKRMLAVGKGSIINIGSLASITALGRGHVAYSMGMGAVVQMTRELSTEWSGRGVRVNAILPAQVVNAGLKARMATDPNLESTFLSGIPVGRLGVPEDIKGLAVFLASEASTWITGALVPMDGGNLAMNAGGSVAFVPTDGTSSKV
ncbi:short-chain dehydrogenase [Candidatus Poribacteria bacterium]|jgi:NAD(P)-dependent dehydrogenase (short-subunit alcohol dehydrogenase family)|nr:short-chain dehydrogenase [Candidatus Poribacteria bacterium]